VEDRSFVDSPVVLGDLLLVEVLVEVGNGIIFVSIGAILAE